MSTTQQNLLTALERLTGVDHATLVANTNINRRSFAQIDLEAKQLAALGDKDLSEVLNRNSFSYSDARPAEGSVFLYLDVSANHRLREHICELRTSILECLSKSGESDVRFSDVDRQHVTLFADVVQVPLDNLAQRVRLAESKYGRFIRSQSPVAVLVKGPHLTGTGAVILECLIVSRWISELRECARKDLRHLPEGAGRVIRDVFHSTIGYLTRSTSVDIRLLRSRLGRLNSTVKDNLVFVREACVTGSENRTLVGKPCCIPLEGRREATKRPDAEVAKLLEEIVDSHELWATDDVLRLRVADVALNCPGDWGCPIVALKCLQLAELLCATK